MNFGQIVPVIMKSPDFAFDMSSITMIFDSRHSYDLTALVNGMICK